MLPYFEQPAFHLGPLTIHAFGIAVAVAVWLGVTVAQRRFQQDGLDASAGNRLGGWMLASGVLGAHLFSVLLYFPDKLSRDPWLLLRVWEDISSLGGILGGVAGALVFFAIRASDQSFHTKLAYLDSIAFVFPASLAIGRVGCALAHDHPGTVTAIPLAVSLKTDAALNYLRDVYAGAGLQLPPNARAMGFHDLGLYEFLYLALVIAPLFAVWARRRRPTGFYIVAFAALYFPVRFGLDVLRVADARYLGLTPAQWTSALIVAALPLGAMRHRKLRFAITGAVILATGWACWGGS
jgi:phosphatidylglycerol:prolipoprotein diacylglycerol transferase